MLMLIGERSQVLHHSLPDDFFAIKFFTYDPVYRPFTAKSVIFTGKNPVGIHFLNQI